MSRTMTILKASLDFLKRSASLRRFSLLRMCCCQSGPSSALPVITIFATRDLAFRLIVVILALAHSGRSLMIAL